MTVNDTARRSATTPTARPRTAAGSGGRTPGRIALYVALGLGGFLMVMPFIWMILTSFKALGDVATFSWLPVTWHPENYVAAWQSAPFDLYFRNSLIVSIGQVVPLMIICTAAGYALAQLPIRGAKGILNYFIFLLVIPFQILIVPLFLIVRAVPLAGGNDILGQGGTGWINTFAALIVPFIASPLYVFLARQFFVSLPPDLADAARIDGLGEISIFLRIMAPLAKPAFVTIALFSIESSWNGFIWPLVSTSSESIRPLQFGLASFAQSAGNGGQVEWPFLMAMATVATLPMILLFIFAQRYFVAGLATSGIKG